MGAIADMSIDAAKQPFFDKSTYPVVHLQLPMACASFLADPAFAMAVTLAAE